MEDIEEHSEVHELLGGFGKHWVTLANIQDESKTAQWHQEHLRVADE